MKHHLWAVSVKVIIMCQKLRENTTGWSQMLRWENILFTHYLDGHLAKFSLDNSCIYHMYQIGSIVFFGFSKCNKMHNQSQIIWPIYTILKEEINAQILKQHM